MRREREHDGGLALAAVNVGARRLRRDLRQIERMDDAGIEREITRELVKQIVQDAAIAAVAVDDHEIARR
jgi:hypothetical protein